MPNVIDTLGYIAIVAFLVCLAPIFLGCSTWLMLRLVYAIQEQWGDLKRGRR